MDIKEVQNLDKLNKGMEVTGFGSAESFITNV